MQKEFDLIRKQLEEQAIQYARAYDEDGMEEDFGGLCATNDAMLIVNQVAEEYSHRNTDLVIDSSHRNEEMCEWIVDGPRYTTCTGNDFIQDDPCDWEYCPYCGKKIKVVE